jgi:hypothetical protein
MRSSGYSSTGTKEEPRNLNEMREREREEKKEIKKERKRI